MSQRMLADIDSHFRDTCLTTGMDSLSMPVRAAMEIVDRCDFVPVASIGSAYRDSPLPIGDGQTISQPFIVALMTQLLATKPGDRVLEIGTGSGYQAAVLAQLVTKVFTLEIIDTLAHAVAQRLQQLGYGRISVKCADGYRGWQEVAPFDNILVTAAINEVPLSLLDQLREGGRMVLPLGNPGGGQQLTVVHKQLGGSLSHQAILPVRFVPFTRAH
jgi:protein-L-isoaspartate(D-aspartate) O-methyltransferase